MSSPEKKININIAMYNFLPLDMFKALNNINKTRVTPITEQKNKITLPIINNILLEPIKREKNLVIVAGMSQKAI